MQHGVAQESQEGGFGGRVAREEEREDGDAGEVGGCHFSGFRLFFTVSMKYVRCWK